MQKYFTKCEKPLLLLVTGWLDKVLGLVVENQVCGQLLLGLEFTLDLLHDLTMILLCVPDIMMS